MGSNLKLIICAGILLVTGMGTKAQESKNGPDAILKNLLDGNKRYTTSAMIHPDQSAVRRAEVAKKQMPFAIIVSCSDSRVPPEVIFDQGMGDLFVIRVAGNVLDEAAMGSIEYAVEHLGVTLIVVLGHERCGAVDATVKGGEVPGHIAYIVKCIAPAVQTAKNQQGDLLDNSVKANIELVVDKLKTLPPILAEKYKEGEIKIVGARYDLDEGKVEVLPE